MNTVKWDRYDFEVCTLDGNWSDQGGVYIFTGLSAQNLWVPYYIGETKSFRDRVPGHERRAEAVRLGATHVHALVAPQEATRVAIQDFLIQQYRPILNVQGM